MVLSLLKCVQQVTGTGKSESNYEEEKKSVECRRIEYLIKVITGGGRLSLVRGLVFQKKIEFEGVN